MVKCSYCGRQAKQSKLRIFVEISGRILNFCSSKCRRNYNLGRDAKKVGWVRKEE